MSTNNSALAHEVLALTKDFVRHFWSGDVKWCASVLAPEFIWIGAQAEQMGLNASNFEKTHSAIIKEAPHVALMNEKYSLIDIPAPKVFITTAEYFGYTEPTAQEAFAGAQRCTFIWKQTPQGLKLVHYHVSNPLSVSKKGENFPTSFSKEVYRYTLLLSSRRCYRSTVELKDILGNVHVLRLAEIVYLEAQKQSTIVHTSEGSFRLREGITKVADMLNEVDPVALVRIHRSYVVNPLYVKTIKSDAIELTTKQTLPLSNRRRSEATELIAKARNAEA